MYERTIILKDPSDRAAVFSQLRDVASELGFWYLMQPWIPPTKECPECGDLRVWDSSESPAGWRHKHDSRWCEMTEDDSAPILPTDWGTP